MEDYNLFTLRELKDTALLEIHKKIAGAELDDNDDIRLEVYTEIKAVVNFLAAAIREKAIAEAVAEGKEEK